jgi:hypothetical protein
MAIRPIDAIAGTTEEHDMNPIQTSMQAELDYRHERLAKDFPSTARRQHRARAERSHGRRRHLIKVGARGMA